MKPFYAVGVSVVLAFTAGVWSTAESAEPFRIGIAEADITPPVAFPMAGYYYERHADRTIDPLEAKAIVFRDGSVRTWMKSTHPAIVRVAGPTDPEIGLLLICDALSNRPRGVLSTFALHLDTGGGTRWSEDYPFFIEHTLRQHPGDDLIPIFGTGCCGDINHADPSRYERNNADLHWQFTW